MGFLADLQIGWLNGWIYSATVLLVSSSAYLFAKGMTSFAGDGPSPYFSRLSCARGLAAHAWGEGWFARVSSASSSPA